MAGTAALFEFRAGRTPWALESLGTPSSRKLEAICTVERTGEGGEEEKGEDGEQVQCWEDQKRLNLHCWLNKGVWLISLDPLASECLLDTL